MDSQNKLGGHDNAEQLAARAVPVYQELVADGLSDPEIFEICEAIILRVLPRLGPPERLVRAMVHVAVVSNAGLEEGAGQGADQSLH